jgi:hypothetical protein
MVLTLIRSYGWSPFVIEEMYLDAVDYLGIEMHYNDIDEQIKKNKIKNP